VTINHSYIPSTQNAAPSIRRRLLSSTSSLSTSSNPTKATFLHQYFASNSSPWLREIARPCLTGLAAFGTGFACGRFGGQHRDLEDASLLHLVPTKHALPTVKVVLPSPLWFDLPPLYFFLRHPVVFIGHSRTYIFFFPNLPIVLKPTAMDGRDGDIVGIVSATNGCSCATHVCCGVICFQFTQTRARDRATVIRT
jgi:hypothetical protein